MMSRSETVLIPTPISAVKGAICFTCFKAAAKLNRCSGCKRVFYCSGECQKKDWKRSHKKLCLVLSGINELDCSKGPQTWEDYRGEMWMRISAFRQQTPRLPINDERILQYQPYCTTCHRDAIQIPPDSKLRLCPKCQIAAHCTSCTLSPHDPVCPLLAEVTTSERFAISHYLSTGEPSLQMPTATPRTTYLPLSTANSWYDYYTRISDKSMVSGLLSPDLKPLAGNDEMACAMIAGTDKGSMMLTIIAALEAVFPDLGTKKKVTLHLIGANAKELDALMLFEEILHILPALKEIHCVFVGLELPTPMGVEGEKMVLDCCAECVKGSRVRSMEMWKGAYHDFVGTEGYEMPDLGAAFQTGHSQECVEEWTPTIKYLVDAGHATVFTTFNGKECVEEKEILRKLNARFLVEAERNKWRGMRPLLEVMEETENSVYYNHQYWYVVEGRGIVR